MEKLIELLKEYDKIRSKKSNKSFNRDLLLNNFVNLPDRSLWESELIVISSSYWFIKWLVDNDKIDLEKIWRFKAERKNTQIIAIANKSDFYLSLLMLLSIQDEPINFLVSILK